MKRRTFLKTVGGAAGAAALGGCATAGNEKAESTSSTHAKAKSTKASGNVATASKPPFNKKHSQRCTTGINRDNNPAFSPTFKLRRRMPGWFPDAFNPNDDEDYLFPEEMIKHNGTIPFGFTLPTIGKPTRRQLLGKVLPTKPNAQEPFDKMLCALADLVRWYNIYLYEVRRFHYLKKFGTALSDNPYGKQPPLPPLGHSLFNKKAQDAEDNWTAAAKALDDFIDSGIGMPTGAFLPIVAVDMVQVNNYIISMRVVAQQSIPDDLTLKEFKDLKAHILEVGGSSSSHVSISSAFSSPTP
jgi:hypothetical protein